MAKAGDKSFTADERAAMKARAAEMKAEREHADGEKMALDAIRKMGADDRKIGEKIHQLVKEEAPALKAKTWYGMPAYALDGQVVCFFQAAGKFKARYATFGFSDKAKLDDGGMWPAAFAVTKLGAAEEKQIRALIRKAIGG